MEQVLRLISKVCIVLTLLFVLVVIEEYFAFNRRLKNLYEINPAEDYDKPEYMRQSSDRLHRVMQAILFVIFICADSATTVSDAADGGIIYDAREVILNISIVYGPVVTTVTALAAAITRIFKDAGNAAIPVISISYIYLMEMSLLYYIRKRGKRFRTRYFAILAGLTGCVSFITVFSMEENAWNRPLVPVLMFLFIYPISSTVAYRIIDAIKTSNRLIFELYKSDDNFKRMREELQERLDELRENEIHFKTMFYYSGEAIFLIKDNKIVEVNKAGIKMLGSSREEDIVGTKFSSYVMELTPNEVNKNMDINDLFERAGKGETIRTEMQILSGKIDKIHIEVFMINLKTPNNEYVYLSARDISIRKVRERELLYKSRYDELTNVANRNYFNEVINKLVSLPESYPICYLMADINGLKLTNDVFGHAKGDELIVKIASVLNGCCRSNDIVARIGGDEFAIFFTNTDESIAKALIHRVNKKLDSEKYDAVKPSVAMGYSIKKSIDEEIDFNEVVKKADDMMYENKSASREENRKIFLENMLNKLYEISPEETIKVKMLKGLIENFKNIYHLDAGVEKKIDKLAVYVNVGKLITPRLEWDMKGNNLHTLKFSRKLIENTAVILSIIGNLEHSIISAEELYMLNENWDGSGEKYGNVGDEIPLAIRVFRMIYDMYYLKTHKEIVGVLTNDEIVALIKSESGKRYDPQLCECRLEEIL